MFGSDHKVKRLRDVPFFRQCSLADVRLIASAGDMVRVRPGDVISDGSGARQFVVVLSGEAELADGDVVSAGESYGAVELLDERARGRVLRMRSEGDVVVFGRREFSSLLRRVPGFGAGLARQLAALLAR